MGERGERGRNHIPEEGKMRVMIGGKTRGFFGVYWMTM